MFPNVRSTAHNNNQQLLFSLDEGISIIRRVTKQQASVIYDLQCIDKNSSCRGKLLLLNFLWLKEVSIVVHIEHAKRNKAEVARMADAMIVCYLFYGCF